MIRRFEIDIECASCAIKLEKVLKQYIDLKYSINVLEKILNIEADEKIYNNDKIIEIIAQAGIKGYII